jgi:hypothetical protein
MLDTRSALTQYLQNNESMEALGVTIIQEDEFTSMTPKPTLIITYDGASSVDGTLFREERWDIWIVTENSDYWTIGKIAQVLRKELDHKPLDHETGQESTALSLSWVGDGPAVPDQQYRVHTQIQSYTALVFDTALDS